MDFRHNPDPYASILALSGEGYVTVLLVTPLGPAREAKLKEKKQEKKLRRRSPHEGIPDPKPLGQPSTRGHQTVPVVVPVVFFFFPWFGRRYDDGEERCECGRGAVCGRRGRRSAGRAVVGVCLARFGSCADLALPTYLPTCLPTPYVESRAGAYACWKREGWDGDWNGMEWNAGIALWGYGGEGCMDRTEMLARVGGGMFGRNSDSGFSGPA